MARNAADVASGEYRRPTSSSKWDLRSRHSRDEAVEALVQFDERDGRPEDEWSYGCPPEQGEKPLAHPNEDLARRGYEAFATGDMATLNELFADDIVWHAPGRNELAGTFRGKDEVFANLQKNMELTGGTFKLDIHAILADDEHAVTLLRASAEREGKALNDNTVQVFHIKDGKLAESWLHPSDAYASDEFWS
jgi:hypothetical protein